MRRLGRPVDSAAEVVNGRGQVQLVFGGGEIVVDLVQRHGVRDFAEIVNGGGVIGLLIRGNAEAKARFEIAGIGGGRRCRAIWWLAGVCVIQIILAQFKGGTGELRI